MRFALAGLLAMALAACSEGSPTAPEVTPPGSLAGAPLRDALERIAPTLGTGPAAVSLRSALAEAVEHPTPGSLGAIESALGILVTEQPDLAVEADVIQLAVAAQR